MTVNVDKRTKVKLIIKNQLKNAVYRKNMMSALNSSDPVVLFENFLYVIKYKNLPDESVKILFEYIMENMSEKKGINGFKNVLRTLKFSNIYMHYHKYLLKDITENYIRNTLNIQNEIDLLEYLASVGIYFNFENGILKKYFSKFIYSKIDIKKIKFIIEMDVRYSYSKDDLLNFVESMYQKGREDASWDIHY